MFMEAVTHPLSDTRTHSTANVRNVWRILCMTYLYNIHDVFHRCCVIVKPIATHAGC